jgi:dihydrofolate reductase
MVVLTRDAPQDAAPGFTFAADLPRALAEAKAAAGDRYVAVLGATTAKRCLEAGELDEILVRVAPVLLGDGVRLFERPGGTNIRLEPISVTRAARVTHLWLRVVR